MRAGMLNKRITIQQAVEASDAYGEVDTTWSTFAIVWAAIEPLAGREFLQAKQVAAELTHKITMRYVPGVVRKMRVLYDTRVFDIEAVINVKERGVQHELYCREVV